jgi:cytoplasmic iron level regulating protein YaaA (DUF328/UPF0246 family)
MRNREMKIILSPAKKMKSDDTYGGFGQTIYGDVQLGRPVFLEKTKQILLELQGKSFDELKALWKCNDKIAEQNVNRLNDMDLERSLVPAVLSYEGLAFQYMAPAVFERDHLEYIQSHLRILSGFYGVLKPMDGVTPYRLEMQAKLEIGNQKNLYTFWGEDLYQEVSDESGIIINLASKEYAKCIEKYLGEENQYITITFCEKSGEKLVTKGTYAKMARGEMVRYMAEHKIEHVDQIKNFDRMGYVYREEYSKESEYVFERLPEKKENV